VGDAFDANGRDRRALNGAEKDAPETIPDGGTKTALEGLSRELTKAFGERIGVGD
jgi:hypothetical protein